MKKSALKDAIAMRIALFMLKDLLLVMMMKKKRLT